MLFGTCGCFCCELPKDVTFNANITKSNEQTYIYTAEEITGLIYILREDLDSKNPRIRFEKLDVKKKSDLLHGENGDGQIFPLSASEPTPILDSINLKKQAFTKCHVKKFGVCAEMLSVHLDDMGVIGPWAFDKHIGCYCCNCYNEELPQPTGLGLPSGQMYCPEGGNFGTPCGSGAGGGRITEVTSTEKAKYRLRWLKVPKKKPTDNQYYILAIPIYVKSSHCKIPTGLANGQIKITFWNKKDYMDFNDELGMDSLPPRPCPYYDEKPAGTGDGLDYNKELEKLNIFINVPLGKNGSLGNQRILWAYDAQDTRLKGNGWYEKRQFYTVVDNSCPSGSISYTYQDNSGQEIKVGNESSCAPCPCNAYELPPQQLDLETSAYHERRYFARKYNLPLWWQKPSGISWPMDTGLFMEDCNPAGPTLIEPVGDCCCCCKKCKKRIIATWTLSSEIDSPNSKKDLTSYRCSSSYGDCSKWQIIQRRAIGPSYPTGYIGYPRGWTEGNIRCSGETPCLSNLPNEIFSPLAGKSGYATDFELWVMCATDCKTCKNITFSSTDECPPYP